MLLREIVDFTPDKIAQVDLIANLTEEEYFEFDTMMQITGSTKNWAFRMRAWYVILCASPLRLFEVKTVFKDFLKKIFSMGLWDDFSCFCCSF